MTTNFLEVLELLEKTPKTNDKIKILEENKEVPHLRDFLVYAVDTRTVFNIVKIEEDKGTGTAFNIVGLSTWENFVSLITALINGNATGHAANDAVVNFLRYCTDLEKKWYLKCIQKDIASTKIGRKIMDDVWPGSVLYWKCGLAEQEDEIDKILEEDQRTFQTEYAYVELKENGIRTFFRNKGFTPLIPVGRSGLALENFGILRRALSKLGIPDMMWDGECSVDDKLELVQGVSGFDFTKTEADFTNAKGKVSKKWQDYQEDYARIDAYRQRLKFKIFAAVPTSEWDTRKPVWTYEEMRDYLEKVVAPLIRFHGLEDKLEVVNKYRVDSYIEARLKADEWMAQGFEGAILKSPKHTYQFRRCRDWIKIKEEVETDFQITGYVLQKPKYNGDGTLKPPMIGKFTGHDQAGRKYGVGTGRGWTEEFYIEALKNFDTHYYMKIMKITAQRFTDKAAICPRFDCWRPDKLTLED